MKTPRWLDAILLTFGLLISTAVAAWIVFASPQFAQVFNSFDTELPFVSRFFVQFYLVFLLLPLLVLAVWRYWPYPALRAIAAAGFSFFISLILLALFTWAMYFPIFKLGQAP